MFCLFFNYCIETGVIYQIDEWRDLHKPNNLASVFEISKDYINGTNALTAAQKGM